MKNRLLLITLPMLLVFLFAGCGSKHGHAYYVPKDMNKCTVHANKYRVSNSYCTLTKEYALINITGIGESSMFTIPQYNNSTAAGLQVAAEATLKRNRNYFAIAYPPKLSNFDGSLINTAKEYFEKCEINTANVLSFNTDPCQLHYKPRVVELVIESYKERPENVLTYDAKEVLQYLKEEERYDPESSLGKYKL
ncbi:hypothetical protein CRV02_13085 [Arcobacter sp. CECT 8989]|uniref:hypothetical protein n=1 Tax=Arcobacter sp. CECT 8989 TaxID=2044509 RepID=UPI00100B1B35|nr:hypothetical protein [Arcobacter sp. CECT 8989]RXJ98679.1 hypothetical protein CRV02_13085 [Arcobacter sp. CECT 8989]